jgi:hypothetical protein
MRYSIPIRPKGLLITNFYLQNNKSISLLHLKIMLFDIIEVPSSFFSSNQKTVFDAKKQLITSINQVFKITKKRFGILCM